VLITGTTSGVGRALLEHYAKSGASVVSVNRRHVAELQEQYPSVHFECVDVRDAEQVHSLVSRLAATSQLPDLFILNAGINRVDNDESFQLASFQEVLDTNLYGALHFVAPLTQLPPGPSERHVLAISSMASYVGNPYGMGYFASKRALTSCFDVWSRMYAGTDLVFQQVLLGPVRTAIFSMDAQFPSWMVRLRDLFSGTLVGTVRAVSRFALTRRRRLFYPWQAVPLYLGMRAAQLLSPGFFRGRRTLDGRARRQGDLSPDALDREQ
jgi:NAD(P)-dependent dehydrogenase (short-subunit alcohol dehydrogenase family)